MASVYGGRWKTLGSLPQGGQADVFTVSDLRGEHHGPLLLKRLRNPARLGRFELEIKALKTLNSAHIPKVIDYSIEAPSFFVYRQVGDESLQEASRRAALSIRDALMVFDQVVQAVCDAHSVNICHRDIKPNNVCVTSDLSKAFVIDFGICQFIDHELVLTATDEPLGNAMFAPPECMPGSLAAPGTFSDVYSLGKLFYWMISNGRHIHREDLSERVCDQIAHSSELIRFHLGRLLHGTVLAEPHRRWTAPTLLDKIAEIRELLERLELREQDGILTLWDGLGLKDAFNPNASRSVGVRNNDPESKRNEIAERFTNSSGGDVEVLSVAVATRVRDQGRTLRISICGDDNGKPNDLAPLEVLNALALSTGAGTVLSIDFEARPKLVNGGIYWLVFSLADTNGEVAILSSPESFMPRKAFFAERFKGDPWKSAESRSGPGYAFRLLARRT